MTSLSDLLPSYGSAFHQSHRLITLSVSGLEAEKLLPLEVSGTESLESDYRIQVTCLSPDTQMELKQLVGRAAQVSVLLPEGSYQPRSGLISQVGQLGSDGGFARYQLVIESGFSLLSHRTNSRIFQDQSVPEILDTVLGEHRAQGGPWATAFHWQNRLSKTYPSRSYCLQYQESDYTFLRRLLAEEGIATRYEFQGEEASSPAHTLVLFDDPYDAPAAEQQAIRFHRDDATEEDDTLTAWDSVRRVRSSQSSLATYDYKPVTPLQSDAGTRIDQGEMGNALESQLTAYTPLTHYYGSDTDDLSRYTQLRQDRLDQAAKDYEGAGNARGMAAGTWFQLEDHPRHEGQDADSRRFLVRSLDWQAQNNLPADLKQGLAQWLALDKNATDETPVPYRVRFQAVRRDTPILPGFDPAVKPTAPGLQSATVVGPAGEEIHTDDLGRIKVQFHWARNQDHPNGGAALDDRSSCWIRVATPWAGSQWGNQFLPRVGQEVLVDFLEGDIDRPIVTGAVYNGRHRPPDYSGQGTLPANRTLSGIKTKEYKGGGYNELLFDDSTGEIRAKLSSEHGKTQLNQGYLIHPRSEGKGEPRGEGFELRTDNAGALRAAQGLLLSADARIGAQGKQLDRKEALSQLQSAQALSQTLGEVAAKQLANLPETGKDNQLVKEDKVPGETKATGHQHHLLQAVEAWEKGTNTEKSTKVEAANQQGGQQPVILMTAPAGIATATPGSMTLATGTNLDTVSQRDTNQTTGRRWIHNVGESISQFVQGVSGKIALKLIAAKGKIQMQAQSGEIEITGDQSITITSVKERVHINAGKEILLTCGNAYVRIAGGNIEIHAPGKVSVKGAKKIFSGPDSLDSPLPALPKIDSKNWLELDLDGYKGKAMAGVPYTLKFADGTSRQGKLDGDGHAREEKIPPGSARVIYHNDPNAHDETDEHHLDDFAAAAQADLNPAPQSDIQNP